MQPTILSTGRAPSYWVEEFAKRDIAISERTLRERARRLGACHVMGKAMIITPEQIDVILEEARCRLVQPVPKEIGMDVKTEWQPIESAPKDGTVVVVFRAGLSWDRSFGPIRDYVERCELGWFEDGRWFESGTGHDFHEPWAIEEGITPTHWMPLPAPPRLQTEDTEV